MSTSAMQWDQCKAALRSKIPEPFYHTFIEPIKALQTSDTELSLVVPQAGLKDHIEMRYGAILRETIKKHFPGQISFIQLKASAESAKYDSKDTHTEKSIAPKAKTDTKASSTNQPIQWDETFLPHHVLIEDLTELCSLHKFHRPIFISGGSGAGKTTLARKWSDHFQGDAQALSLPEFLEGFVSSIRSKSTIEWKKSLRKNKLLLIDDLQLLKSTANRCQEELRNLIDDFEREQKLIVFFADTAPDTLSLNRDLKSRLIASKHIHLMYPAKDTRIQIIKNCLKQDKSELPLEIIDHLANQISSDMRLLKAAVHRLTFQSQKPTELTKQDVDRICEPLYQHDVVVRPETIVSIVADFFHITADDIRSKAKNKTVSLARHFVSVLCSSMLSMTLSEIARVTNRKDHTGVIYALQRVEKLVNEDMFYARQLDELRDLIIATSKKK